MTCTQRLLAGMLACGFIGTAAAQAAPPSVAGSAPTGPRFEFARLRSAIVEGDLLGHRTTGPSCTGSTDMHASARLEPANSEQAALAFNDEAASQGLASNTPALSAFEASPARLEADYRIGGVLQSFSVSECVDGRKLKGFLTVTVKWEVFAPALQKVVLAKLTSGTFSVDTFTDLGGSDLERRAYRAALREFLASSEFKALRATSVTAEAPANEPPRAALHLKLAPALSGDTRDNTQRLRASVVTVVHEGSVGAGFYVAEGYVLTAYEVVGNARYVSVRLADGRVLVGEVLHARPHYTVALNRTPPAGVPALHVSMAATAVGSSVFVLGPSPTAEVAGTFARGIADATAKLGEADYLQSDVAFNPGDKGAPLFDASSTVIGLAVARVNKPAGPGFFLPIREAANGLQLVFETAALSLACAPPPAASGSRPCTP